MAYHLLYIKNIDKVLFFTKQLYFIFLKFCVSLFFAVLLSLSKLRLIEVYNYWELFNFKNTFYNLIFSNAFYFFPFILIIDYLLKNRQPFSIIKNSLKGFVVLGTILFLINIIIIAPLFEKFKEVNEDYFNSEAFYNVPLEKIKEIEVRNNKSYNGEMFYDNRLLQKNKINLRILFTFDIIFLLTLISYIYIDFSINKILSDKEIKYWKKIKV